VITLWRTARDTAAPAAQVLAEAAAALGDGAAGWLASPTALTTVRLDGGTPRTPTGPARLDGVFGARLFGPAADLRWVQTNDSSWENKYLIYKSERVPLPI